MQAETINIVIDGTSEAGSDFSKTVTANVIQGRVFLEGDIYIGDLDEVTLADEEQNTTGGISAYGVVINSDTYRWSNGVVPYVMSTDFSSTEESLILEAMNTIENYSGIRFVERSNQSNYVNIIYGEGCYSQVGMRGGSQELSLGQGCFGRQPTHELLHAVGFWHEQSRSDRDSYVDIHWENIESGKEHNFDIHTSDGEDVGSYDLKSIMHYKNYAFSSNAEMTISNKADPNSSIGGDQMTDTDIETLQHMYGYYGAVTLNAFSHMCYGQNALYWTAYEGADNYRVERFGNGTWGLFGNYSTTTVDVNVSSDSKFRVKVCDSAGNCGVESNTVTARYVSNCW